MKYLRYSFFLLFCLYAYQVEGQNFTSLPFTAEHWDFGSSDISPESYMGKESYRLDGAAIATKNVSLKNGTIELDMNFPYGRFFPSILFRVIDGRNGESFYVRPHQSGNPDATQYTPVFNGYAGWQLYHGQGHGEAVELTPDTWHHVKINILDDQADIYFNNMEEPLIQVTDLKRDIASGEIGLSSGAPVYFANVKYTKRNPTLTTRTAEPFEEPQGLIKEWQISDVVANEDFREKPTISTEGLSWTRQPTEYTGTINLAKFLQSSEGKTTVLAKLDIESESDIRKQVIFGYSDFVWVFVNGEQIYAGRNDFRSRDYRYLGTIGWFDSVYLPLKEGDNEVVFVVGENFGGWGIKAKIENQEGIEIR